MQVVGDQSWTYTSKFAPTPETALGSWINHFLVEIRAAQIKVGGIQWLASLP